MMPTWQFDNSLALFELMLRPQWVNLHNNDITFHGFVLLH